MNQITAEGSRHMFIHLGNHNLCTVRYRFCIIAGCTEGTESVFIRTAHHNKRHIHRKLCAEKFWHLMEKSRTVIRLTSGNRFPCSGAKEKTIKNKMALHLRTRIFTFPNRNQMTDFHIFIHLIIINERIDQICRFPRRMTGNNPVPAFNIADRFFGCNHF